MRQFQLDQVLSVCLSICFYFYPSVSISILLFLYINLSVSKSSFLSSNRPGHGHDEVFFSLNVCIYISIIAYLSTNIFLCIYLSIFILSMSLHLLSSWTRRREPTWCSGWACRCCATSWTTLGSTSPVPSRCRYGQHDDSPVPFRWRYGQHCISPVPLICSYRQHATVTGYSSIVEFLTKI